MRGPLLPRLLSLGLPFGPAALWQRGENHRHRLARAGPSRWAGRRREGRRGGGAGPGRGGAGPGPLCSLAGCQAESRPPARSLAQAPSDCPRRRSGDCNSAPGLPVGLPAVNACPHRSCGEWRLLGERAGWRCANAPVFYNETRNAFLREHVMQHQREAAGLLRSKPHGSLAFPAS